MSAPSSTATDAPRSAPRARRAPPPRFIRNILILLAVLHGYVALRLLPALPVGRGVKFAGVLALGASFALIIAGARARRRPPSRLKEVLVWAGSLTGGLFSSLAVLTLARDALLLAARLLGLAPRYAQLAADSAVTVPVLAALASLVGFIAARRRPRVVEVDVPLPSLAPALAGFTIAQISDVHVGTTIRREFLSGVVKTVNALGADLIAITGDLVDGSVEELAAQVAPLAELTARHGVFFVTGNHEYYSGAPAWIQELRRLGIRVLRNEHVVLGHRGTSLLLAGVTDFSAHHFDPAERSDPRAALAGAPEHVRPRVLLAHQPRTAPEAAAAGFDLQLSGHTHGGQFWPWNLLVGLQQPFPAGLDRLSDLLIYTSRGTGYWGPPKRLGVPSEITRLRLVAA